jgi:uncharacterized Zn finger protein
MAKRRGDHDTFDILEDYTPPVIVERYDSERVRTATLRSKLARAVAETLNDSGMDRDVIAADMSEWLGEDVSKNMLNNYASEAQVDHTIPYLRLIALVQVTGDVRLMQIGADMFDYIVVEKRFLKWVRLGMKADRRETIHKAADGL